MTSTLTSAPADGDDCLDRRIRSIAAAMDYLPGLELLAKRFGSGHPKVAECLDGIATLCRDQDMPADAELLYRRALALLERSLGPEDDRLAGVLENLTVVLYESGREDEARVCFARAAALRQAEERRFRLSPGSG